MKRLPWFEILLVVAVISVSLYAALSDAQNLSMRWFVRDDAYYYFKVAQNISEGHGSTFDGINLTNGYHPLWLWICVPIFALARFDLILPLRVLLMVMSGLSVATAVLLYRLIGKVFAPAIGAIAAVYWVFSQDNLERVYQQGLETGIAAFFIVLFVYKLYEFERSWRKNPVTTRQLGILGIIAVLVSFSRLDLIFFTGMAGIWIVFRKHPLRYFLPYDIVAIVISVLLGFFFRISFTQYLKYSDVAMTMIVVSLIVKIVGAFLFGLYQHPASLFRGQLPKSLFIFSASTAAITGGIMIVVSAMAKFEGFPRTIILYDFLLITLFFGITRYAALGLRSNAFRQSNKSSPIKQFMENWKTWLNDSFVYYGIMGGAVALYLLWNKITFGTSSPVSGQIKRWWGSLSGNVYGGSANSPLSFFGIDHQSEANAWYPVSNILGNWSESIYKFDIPESYRFLILISIFAIVVYLILLIKRRKAVNAIGQLAIIPLFCGAWIQVISYHITGYSAYKEWYWIGQLITEILIISLIAGMLHQAIRRYPASQTFIQLFATGVFVIMGLSYWGFVQQKMPYNHWGANEPNNAIAAFIEEHTEPGSIIGMTGGGNAGYFIHDRTVVNMDGLINSYEYFQLLKSKAADDYLAEFGMDYILANPIILDQLPYRGQFNSRMVWTGAQFGGKDLVHYEISQP